MSNRQSIILLSLYFFGVFQISKPIAASMGLSLAYGYVFGVIGGVLILLILFGLGAWINELNRRKREQRLREIQETRELINSWSRNRMELYDRLFVPQEEPAAPTKEEPTAPTKEEPEAVKPERVLDLS